MMAEPVMLGSLHQPKSPLVPWSPPKPTSQPKIQSVPLSPTEPSQKPQQPRLRYAYKVMKPETESSPPLPEVCLFGTAH